MTQAELIASSAAAVGAKLTQTRLANVAAMIDTYGRIETGKAVTVAINGQDQEVSAWIAGLIFETPASFQAGQRNEKASAPAAGNMTEAAIAHNVARKSPEARQARAAEILAAHGGNPFSTATGNMSVAGLVGNLDPALAAKLQAEAVQ